MGTVCRDRHVWRCLGFVLVATAIFGSVRPVTALEVLVPAYFYPVTGSPWNDLNTAAARVPLTAIMNPGNGPGAQIDSNYSQVVNNLRSAGGRVLGYVYTSYAVRPLEDVFADIDRYRQWYPIDGIFVDEMSNSGAATYLDYYQQLYTHIKDVNGNWEVMGNPGTHTQEVYLSRPLADKLIVTEWFGNEYAGYVPSAWNYRYPATKIVHLVHTEPSADQMRVDLDLALERNAGAIYITDDVLANPWDRLPSYWEAKISAIESINAQAPDLNRDGTIDAADAAQLFAQWGQMGRADFNGDGIVDAADAGRMFSQWTGDGTFGLMVPEPSIGWGVMALASLSRWSWRPRLHRQDVRQ